MKIKHKISEFLEKEYNKTLVDKKIKRKASLSRSAGRILILFFAAMLLFTVISRAAASVTVAQALVVNPERGYLNYTVSGIGTIKTAGENYITVMNGCRIDKIMVTPGQKVESGDTLFSYDIKELQDRLDQLNIEMEKIKLQIEQTRLNIADLKTSSAELSKLSLNQAEDNLKAGKLKLKEALAAYNESKGKTVAQLLKDKKLEYEDAVKSLDTYSFDTEKGLISAQRAVEDADNALTEANEPLNYVKGLIEAYKDAANTNNYNNVYYAREAIFIAFYGSEEVYDQNKTNISLVESDVSEAYRTLDDKAAERLEVIEQYRIKEENASQALEEAKNSTDEDVSSEENIAKLTEDYNKAHNEYVQIQQSYNNEIAILQSNYDSKQASINKLKSKNIKLDDLLTKYQLAVKGFSDEKTAWDELYTYILGDKRNDAQKNVKAKELNLNRAKEDRERLTKEAERGKSDLQAKISDISDIIKSMEAGTFDYTEYLEAKQQEIKAAEDAVRVLEQSVSLNRLQYEQAKENDAGTLAANEKSAKNAELTEEGYKLDLAAKEKESASLNEILDNNGKIKSPFSGFITEIGIEEGKITSGGELIKFGLGKYVLTAEFDKESINNVKVGSELEVTRAGEEVKIKAAVDGLSISPEGTARLTAALPEGDFLFGETASFKVVQQSGRFNICVPLQTVKKDNNGYFVLVTREQKGILGSELYAFRVNVDILSKDNTKAAVDGGLSYKDNVIVQTSKNIINGDRVRLKLD